MDREGRRGGLRGMRGRSQRPDPLQLLPGAGPGLGAGRSARFGSLGGLARGWGKSEEDLPAEREAERANRHSGEGGGPPAEEAQRRARVQGIELSLARIADQLSKTVNADRRRALEAARAELEEQKKRL